MTARAVDWRRIAGGAALTVLMAVLMLDSGRLIALAIEAMGYRYDLDYGEGIVWQQMADIAAGRGYAPLGVFPAIVYHYPPVYHLIVAAAVAVTGGDPLAVGRSVSLAATLASMLLIGALAWSGSDARDRAARLIGAAVGAMTFAASPTLLGWAGLMRVDMVATALSLTGLWFIARRLSGRGGLIAASICFVAAVYTKQTAILAPLSAFAALLIVDRRAGWHFALLCGGMAVAVLAVLVARTDGQFLRHVVSYNVNRIDMGRLPVLIATLETQAAPLIVAVLIGAKVAAGRMRTANPAALLLAIYLVSRLLSLPLSLKSGSNANYLIDLFSVAAALTGLGAAGIAAAVTRGAPWPRALLTLAVLVALPLQAGRLAAAPLADAAGPMRDAAWTRMLDGLVVRIAAERRPVVSDGMVLILRAGKPVQLEPAIVAELGHGGAYDERALVALIRARAFGFFITQGDGNLYRERYNPAVRAAIAAAYPRIERHGELIVHLPPVPTR